jgi:hypothetical protein
MMMIRTSSNDKQLAESVNPNTHHYDGHGVMVDRRSFNTTDRDGRTQLVRLVRLD